MELRFFPESEEFTTAAEEYQRIWEEEGRRMIQALEEISGLRFGFENISVMVFEGTSQVKGCQFKMRASYSSAIKKARLIHELGHRLLAQLKYKPNGMDEHRILYLFLYDVWKRLYGKIFADYAVEEEKELKGLYDYKVAWEWALSLTGRERHVLWEKLKQNHI